MVCVILTLHFSVHVMVTWTMFIMIINARSKCLVTACSKIIEIYHQSKHLNVLHDTCMGIVAVNACVYFMMQEVHIPVNDWAL